MSEAKRRQTQGSSAVAYGHGRASQRRGAHLSAFHRGSRPKESFIARDAASGQASWDVAGTRFAHPFERALPAPACPVVQRAPRTPVTSVPIPKFAQLRGAPLTRTSESKGTLASITGSCGFGFEVPV